MASRGTHFKKGYLNRKMENCICLNARKSQQKFLPTPTHPTPPPTTHHHHTKHIENYGPKMNCHACGKNFVPIITHNQYHDLARLIQGWHDYVNCNLRIAKAKCQKFQELFFISLCMAHESCNPAGTRRNNNVIITSRRRRFDVIMMLLSLQSIMSNVVNTSQ